MITFKKTFEFYATDDELGNYKLEIYLSLNSMKKTQYGNLTQLKMCSLIMKLNILYTKNEENFRVISSIFFK